MILFKGLKTALNIPDSTEQDVKILLNTDAVNSEAGDEMLLAFLLQPQKLVPDV